MAEATSALGVERGGHLVIPERGAISISLALWHLLAADAQFRWLLEQGIVTKKESRVGQVILAGTGYVGRAVIGDIVIDLVEKRPGVLQMLLADIHAEAFTIGHFSAPASPSGIGITVLVHQFLEALRADISREMDVGYTNVCQISTDVLGGRLDLRRTIALRAQGRIRSVAVTRPTLTYATPKNHMIAAALHEIDRLRTFILLAPQDITAVHAYLELFRGHSGAPSHIVPDDDQRIIPELLQDSTRQDHDLLVLAMALLEHIGFDQQGNSTGRLPRAWFLKLELLFQEAIRRTLQTCGVPRLQVRRVNLSEKPIFSNVRHQYRANPDLVLESAETLVAIGDVKYKVWEDRLDQHDLYQLLAHAAAYGATHAFLVYPHDTWVQRDLGIAATGCRTWAFGLDIMDIRWGLQAAVAAMGMMT